MLQRSQEPMECARSGNCVATKPACCLGRWTVSEAVRLVQRSSPAFALLVSYPVTTAGLAGTNV
ncbi:hypothetical protein E2C01_098203 [Portunus trituberculatus]|uniref:Uncharacterized protein n=1 Tax=Portunus trituberculatus TaxID=210409 RepID=A0A5B7KCB1_PORTR|nr:hypothetical protein [Portunus trituberculatus]